MQIILGWFLLLTGGALYLAQVISSVNFQMAQRLGIQEYPADTDDLVQRSERYTAYWDLVTMVWLPFAGALMINNHDWWPVMSLLGGAIYLDAAGREAMKNLSFRHGGLKTGSSTQQKIFFASYIVMAVIALLVIAYSITFLSRLL